MRNGWGLNSNYLVPFVIELAAAGNGALIDLGHCRRRKSQQAQVLQAHKKYMKFAFSASSLDLPDHGSNTRQSAMPTN